jgi:hypothetical protein
VSSGIKPKNKVPTDDDLKTRIMKVDKPDKDEAIRERVKRSRYGVIKKN